jgi:hypothetical protein
MTPAKIDAFGLVAEPLPFPLPPAPIVRNWHQWYETDTGYAWLRGQVRGARHVRRALNGRCPARRRLAGRHSVAGC